MLTAHRPPSARPLSAHPRRLTRRGAAALFVLLLVTPLVGCGHDEGPFEITETVERDEPLRFVPDDANDRDRLGFRRAQAQLVWTAPAGWVRGPDSRSRIVTWAPAGSQDMVCYASTLRGTAGGLSSNVARWHAEMGRPAPTPDEIAALPRLKVLDEQAVMVTLTGDFRGTGAPPRDGAMLLGLICPRGSGTLFVKMVGPAEAIEAERENFVRFCESLRMEAPR